MRESKRERGRERAPERARARKREREFDGEQAKSEREGNAARDTDKSVQSRMVRPHESYGIYVATCE